MATPEDVLRLRRLVAELGTETYTDEALSAMVDAGGSVEQAASDVWQEKAALLAPLVNTSESGSSRSMGDAYKNALAMSAHFKKQATPEVVADTTYPMTVPIERA